ARSYWEEGQENARAAGQAPTPVSIPVGFTTFPGEIWRTPRSWVEKAYPNQVIYFNEVDRGGHFAAWEEPGLFSEELRAAFRSLRYWQGWQDAARRRGRVARPYHLGIEPPTDGVTRLIGSVVAGESRPCSGRHVLLTPCNHRLNGPVSGSESRFAAAR